MSHQIYDVGQAPPIGEVPKEMHAWVVRQERFGEPTKAWQKEVVKVPDIAADEVLVYVMAAGINYNNVWAGLGVPVDVIKMRQRAGATEDFHIGGSDASGIVYQVGKDVTNVKVGDHVVLHCGTWDRACPMVLRGEDPMYSPSFRIWGYETNYGSFAQFTKVQAHQCLPKPTHLTWEEAASYMLVGATAYRMLFGWQERSLQRDDVVLIWGGAGGLGSMAIQIASAIGAIPVAVVSSDAKAEYCKSLGAKGAINRKEFDHWGMLPHWKDQIGYSKWLKGVRQFGKAIWEIVGEKKNPRIVFEHPGESTIPTSMFVCETGGMVVICAGTTGYNATVDLRYLWMRQKRLQGSHFANDEQAKGLNEMVINRLVDPCLSKTFVYDDLPAAHQLMYENRHPQGNMAVLIGAPREGLGADEEKELPASIELLSQDDLPESLYIPHAEQEQEDVEIVAEDTIPVSEIMHKGLITCRDTDSVIEVAKKLITHQIHAIVVTDQNGYAEGVISQTDVVLARQGRSTEELSQMQALAIMTPSLIGCPPETTISEAVTMMTRRGIHRLLVLERDGKKTRPVGVVSMTDIVTKMLGEESHRPRSGAVL